MLVKIKTDTCFCGMDVTEIYEFPDGTTEDRINEYADELAWERACDWNVEEEAAEQGIDPDVMAYVEFIAEEKRAEVLEWYGEILKP